jgi:ATP synthase protein I
MRMLHSRPIRMVLRWQGFVTLGLAVAGGLVSGGHGALSAALGGMVGILAAVGFAIVGSLGSNRDVGQALLQVIRAEAVKVLLIVVLLWLVLKVYKDAQIVWFIGSFLASAVILSVTPAMTEDRSS